jgi:hypothetical protein
MNKLLSETFDAMVPELSKVYSEGGKADVTVKVRD